MSLEQAILEAVQTLPPDKQREVYEHAARLRADNTKRPPFKSVRGLWADPGISLSAEELDDCGRASRETICNAGRRSRHSHNRLVSRTVRKWKRHAGLRADLSHPYRRPQRPDPKLPGAALD